MINISYGVGLNFMGRIVSIKTNYIIARQEDGKIQMIPKAECRTEFAVGDIVDIIVDGSKITLIKKGSAPAKPSSELRSTVSTSEKQMVASKNDAPIANQGSLEPKTSSENLESKTLNKEKLVEENTVTASQTQNTNEPTPSFLEKFKLSLHQKMASISDKMRKIFKKTPQETVNLDSEPNEEKPVENSSSIKPIEEISKSDLQKTENSETPPLVNHIDKPSFLEKLKSSFNQKIAPISDKIHEIFKKAPNRTVNLNLKLNEEKSLSGEQEEIKSTENSNPASKVENVTESTKEEKINDIKNNASIVEPENEKPKNSDQSPRTAVISIPGGQIVEIKNDFILIKKEDGNVQEIKKSHFNFEPIIGDIVDVFSNGTELIIVKKISCN